MCAQSRTTPRTSHQNTAEAVKRLGEVARSPEVDKLFKAMMKSYRRAGHLPEEDG